MTASDSTQTNNNLVVVGENGEPYTLLQRSIDNGIETLLLGRSDGSQITLPLSDLSWKGAGTWLLTDAVRDARGLVIPVVEERLEVSRERVETGRVRISKSVEAREVVVDDPLKRESVRVEHVPINQVVTGAVPQVREEGDVTVIPILEERVVTRTELVLVEEVRIHRDHSEYHDPQRVTLRKEVVVVERFGEDGRPLPS
ncbi:YsnF/AvaK domain-containing protein [Vulcanococcus limneticus]|uniref:YsnF/AvaK domain-containing protein n=1 Tax=Vulcanococcus limneticus TaxID=2170428 RepID=UPI00398BECA6